MGFIGIIGAIVLIIYAINQNKNNNRQLEQRQDPSRFISYDPNNGYQNFQNQPPDLNRSAQRPGFQNNQYSHPAYNEAQPDDLKIENGMAKTTRYLQSNNLRSLRINNGLGSVTVYYDQVVIPPEGSKLTIDNGLGVVNVYIPPFYRLRLNQDNGIGSVEVFGNPSMNPADPLIDCYVDNGLGKVKLHFS